MSPEAGNITWHDSSVGHAERQRLLGQKGCIVWLTGLSGSGKSTIAHALEQRLVSSGQAAYVLDGDNIRHGLNADLGFSPEDRAENIRRVGEVALLLADAGLIVIAAFISPYRADRDAIRSKAGTGRFYEVHADAPLDVCEERDPKGLYRRARAGKIADFTGIDAPYEPPEHSELVLDTSLLCLKACIDRIVSMLKDAGILSRR